MDPDGQAQDVGYSYVLLLRFTRPLSYYCYAEEGVRLQNLGVGFPVKNLDHDLACMKEAHKELGKYTGKRPCSAAGTLY